MTNKFKHGDRIYPNLEALDASFPYGHGWRGRASCGDTAGAMSRYVNASGPKKYLLDTAFGRSGTRYNVEWVEKYFRSEPEHTTYLMDIGGCVFYTSKTLAARNELMELGDQLTREVSAFEDFEELLAAWKDHGFRPTLSIQDTKAKTLADIYDFVQAARGVKVEAHRSDW